MAEITQSHEWISLVHKQTDAVYRSLCQEMGNFLCEKNKEALSIGKDEPVVQELDKYGKPDFDWSYQEIQHLLGDLQVAQEAVHGMGIEDWSPGSEIRSHYDQLGKAVEWLAEDLRAKFDDLSTDRSLRTLARKDDVLRYFTEMWVLYREAWEQRSCAERPDGDGETVHAADANRAADQVVRELYSVVEDRNLDLEHGHQLLIVVPFASRLYATGFESPMPIIVAPCWGHRQVWTWLGYAHEVGHHVYRNVKGLRDELRVNVIMALWSKGIDYKTQNIWFNWLEETFADLFGLLQVGAEFARTQRQMLLHLPLPVMRRPEVGRDPRYGLLQAADETHPIPYVRAQIAWKALKLLGMQEAAESLESQWRDFFEGGDDDSFNRGTGVNTSRVTARFRDSNRTLITEAIPAGKLEDATDIVLDVMLNEKLHALAEVSSHDDGDQRGDAHSLMQVFFQRPDEDKLEAARRAIDRGSEGEYGVQHLLAAAQSELERLTARGKRYVYGVIETLSDRIVRVIEEHLGRGAGGEIR